MNEDSLDITESTENSTEETSVVDNSSQPEENSSEINLEEQISKALDEPTVEVQEEEIKEEVPEKKEVKDNTEKCPVKFQNEDGTVNVDNLLKSYKELEPLVNEKNSWQKERAELLKAKETLDSINKEKEQKAIEAGYESAEDMQFVYDLAYTEANEYAKYLNLADNPEEVRKMLIEYANNPSEDLMEQIELEFAPSINKKVGIASDRFKQNYEAIRQQNEDAAKYASIENVVKQSVQANKELFDYEPFKTLFTNTLSKYGNNFTFDDAQALMNAFSQMRTLFEAEFEKKRKTESENNAAKENIAALNHSNSAPSVERYSNVDIDKMTAEELNKAISKLI